MASRSLPGLDGPEGELLEESEKRDDWACAAGATVRARAAAAPMEMRADVIRVIVRIYPVAQALSRVLLEVAKGSIRELGYLMC